MQRVDFPDVRLDRNDPADPADAIFQLFAANCVRIGIIIPEPFLEFIPGESLKDAMLRLIAGALFFLISSSRDVAIAFVNEDPNMKEVLETTYQYANTRKIALFLNVILRIGLFNELELSFDDVMLYLFQNGHITESAYGDYREKTQPRQMSHIGYLYWKYLTLCSNENSQFPGHRYTSLIEMSMILRKLHDAQTREYYVESYDCLYREIVRLSDLVDAFFFREHMIRASKEMRMMCYIVILDQMKAICEKHIGTRYSMKNDHIVSLAQDVARRICDIDGWTEEAYAEFVQRYLHQKCPISVHEYDTLEKVKTLRAFFATLKIEKKPTVRRF